VILRAKFFNTESTKDTEFYYSDAVIPTDYKEWRNLVFINKLKIPRRCSGWHGFLYSRLFV